MPAEPPGVVKSADRVLDLFVLLGRWGQEMSHSQIAERLGIPKGSLTPLLRTLMARGFVEYDHVTKGYRLGSMFAQLAQHADDHESLLQVVHPALQEMTKLTEESSLLTKLSGDMGETVDTVIGPHRLVSHMRVGDKGPLYALSGGKAILAHLPDAMVEEYLGRVQFEDIAPNTINTIGRLTTELEQVRQSGISYSIEEFTIGIAGVGAPILSDDRYPVGAVSVVMPAIRFTEAARELAISVLKSAVRRIETELHAVSRRAARTKTRSSEA